MPPALVVAEARDDVLEHRVLGFRIALEPQVGIVAVAIHHTAGQLPEIGNRQEEILGLAERTGEAHLRALARQRDDLAVDGAVIALQPARLLESDLLFD